MGFLSAGGLKVESESLFLTLETVADKAISSQSPFTSCSRAFVSFYFVSHLTSAHCCRSREKFQSQPSGQHGQKILKFEHLNLFFLQH